MTEQRPALFLDRDGVINVDHGYVCSPERTEFIDGIFDLVRLANRQGYLVVVITNQAGIARGFYSESDLRAYMAWMGHQFERHGSWIDAVYYCPHHPTAGNTEYSVACTCRKPAPGMILAAQRNLGVDLAASIMLGDKPSDMAAGKAAGVGQCILVDNATQLIGGAAGRFDEARHVLETSSLERAWPEHSRRPPRISTAFETP